MREFVEKNVLVTGASGGMGRCIATTFAARGARVALLGRTLASLRAVAADIDANHGHALAIACDVRDPRAVDNAIDIALRDVGDIHIVVNCAGIGGGGHTVNESDEQWQNIIATNLHGTYYMTKRILHKSQMLEQHWGRIINIASTGGKQGVVHAAAYTASKHGVVGFCKSLGLELAKSGVTVNAVCPGFVETPMAEEVRANYARLYNITPDAMKTRIEQRVPIGRYVESREVAAVVAFLASQDAQAITAQAWNVCGGLGNY